MKFRMGGLVHLWMHAHELCLDAANGDSNDWGVRVAAGCWILLSSI
jgi:hypothetical protein